MPELQVIKKIPPGKKPLTVYLPDTRGVEVSRYGKGNLKIGEGVFTYSRLPGDPSRPALGSADDLAFGSCVGATSECQAICYARRVVEENGAVYQIWKENTLAGANVPPIPKECKTLRLHVSGDFDSVDYIHVWIDRLTERPDVTCWAYTRSWREPELLPALEHLRSLSNMQLFASMDSSTVENPPPDWRVAWIDGDDRVHGDGRNRIALKIPVLVCPEQTSHKKDCEDCGYCQNGKRNDVLFLRH